MNFIDFSSLHYFFFVFVSSSVSVHAANKTNVLFFIFLFFLLLYFPEYLIKRDVQQVRETFSYREYS